jgi:hypothetical protein
MAEATYASGNLPHLVDGDFPVMGKGYAQLTDEEFTKIASIAKERHYALNWLCKFNDDWDNIPTGTQ